MKREIFVMCNFVFEDIEKLLFVDKILEYEDEILNLENKV